MNEKRVNNQEYNNKNGNKSNDKKESTGKDEYTKNKKPSKSNVLNTITYLSQIGFTMIASVAIGVFLGKISDDFLGTSPWLLLIFSLMGVGAAIRNIFKISNN